MIPDWSGSSKLQDSPNPPSQLSELPVAELLGTSPVTAELGDGVMENQPSRKQAMPEGEKEQYMLGKVLR